MDRKDWGTIRPAASRPGHCGGAMDCRVPGLQRYKSASRHRGTAPGRGRQRGARATDGRGARGPRAWTAAPGRRPAMGGRGVREPRVWTAAPGQCPVVGGRGARVPRACTACHGQPRASGRGQCRGRRAWQAEGGAACAAPGRGQRRCGRSGVRGGQEPHARCRGGSSDVVDGAVCAAGKSGGHGARAGAATGWTERRPRAAGAASAEQRLMVGG